MSKTYELLKFDSLAELYRFTETERPSDSGTSSTADGRGHDWDLSLGYEGARTMASQGGFWREGAEAMSSAMVETNAQLRACGGVTDDSNVHGHTLIVPDFLAGHPDCWEFEEEDPNAKNPVLRFDVSVVASASVDADTLFNRGAAVLSLIDAIENQGIRCELHASWTTKQKSHYFTFTCCVKPAGEPWAPDSVAFALAHPGFMRRLGFAVIERAPDRRSRAQTNDCYGIPTPTPDSAGFDVSLPPLLGGERGTRECGTAGGAMDYVLREYRAQSGLELDQ